MAEVKVEADGHTFRLNCYNNGDGWWHAYVPWPGAPGDRLRVSLMRTYKDGNDMLPPVGWEARATGTNVKIKGEGKTRAQALVPFMEHALTKRRHAKASADARREAVYKIRDVLAPFNDSPLLKVDMLQGLLRDVILPWKDDRRLDGMGNVVTSIRRHGWLPNSHTGRIDSAKQRIYLWKATRGNRSYSGDVVVGLDDIASGDEALAKAKAEADEALAKLLRGD